MTAAAISFISKRYHLHEKLGSGAMGIVYRATDRLTGQTVALKQVIMAPTNLQFSSRDKNSDLHLALAQEFRTLSSLRHPHIISVLDYGFDEQRQPYFTMRLLDQPQTLLDYGRQLAVNERVKLIIQVLQALAYLHRRGILHRDLKPSNILMADDQVRVLDFGLAIEQRQASGVAGTYAYMAPEVLRDEGAMIASDLYSVGVIAYELLAGQHPFSARNIPELVAKVLSSEPDLTPIEKLESSSRPLPGKHATSDAGDVQEVDAEETVYQGSEARPIRPIQPPKNPLAIVVSKLMAKNPKARYQEAIDVIRALSAAIGEAPPEETAAIRESFLQAAKFVGRETELDQLSHALNQAVEGKGSAWLVGGESGVGKSRLIDELRTLALVKGVLVVRGQAVSEGGAPYLVWREVLRSLTLYLELTDEEARILKALVPDIGSLLAREIADPMPLDPQQTQYRLFKTVTGLLRKQKKAIMIVLEDLQWVGSESLALLEHLTQQGIEGLRLLAIGNYRNDERPDLPQTLPAMQVFNLKRLDEWAVEELSAAMLGDAGHQPQLVSLLQRESEGNTFFLVEVVRALAEEAGQLGLIGQSSLPQKILAGGMTAIIERRLNRVPEEARPLLRLMAVAGRQLDLTLVRALASEVNVANWLAICANAVVLEVQRGRWSFAHDKLREAILDGLDEAEQRNFHRTVAETIEAVYPDASDKVATLANHWVEAGDSAKAVHYLALAAQQAVQNTAYHEAIAFARHALSLLQTLPDTPEKLEKELLLQITLGGAVMPIRGYTVPEAEHAFTRAYELCQQLPEKPQLVTILVAIISFRFLRGEFALATQLSKQLLQVAQANADPTSLLQAHWIAGVLLYYLSKNSQARDHLEQLIALYDPLQHHSLVVILGLNPLVGGSVHLAWLLCATGFPDQALARCHEMVAYSHALAHAPTLAQAQTHLIEVFRLRGELLSAQSFIDTGLALATEHGLPFWMAALRFQLGYLLTLQEKPEEGIILVKGAIAIWKAIGIGLNVAQAILAEAYNKAGQIAEGLQQVDEAIAFMNQTGEEQQKPSLYVLRGQLLQRHGAPDSDVEREFLHALDIAREQSAKWFELQAIVSLCRLWQRQGKREEARQRLAEIYGWFTEGFDTPVMKDAKALLEELSVE